MVRHPDLLSGTVVLLIGLAAIFFGARIDVADLTGLSARFFPQFCGTVLALTGLWIAVHGLRAEREPLPFVANRRVIAVTVLFLAYFLSFAYVDFRLGAWAMMLIGMLILGARSLKLLIPVPIVTSLAIYAAFRYGFTILVPTWTS